MKRWLKRVLLLYILLLVGFFGGYAVYARHVVTQAQLPAEQTNAVKHALAAFDLYKLMDQLQLSSAEAYVVTLGILNEQVEQVVKFNSPDSTLEMMKDFHNNIAGISAAAWEHTPHKPCTESAILVLARTEGLLTRAQDFLLPVADKERLANERNPEEAIRWLRTNSGRIRKDTMQKLNAC